MSTKSRKRESADAMAGWVIKILAGLPLAMIAMALISGCSSNSVRIAEQEKRKGVDEAEVPIDFNPPFEMNYISAQQALMRRGKVLVTDIKYIATEKSAHANFLVQDIQSDAVFIDQGGNSGSLSALVKRTHKDAVNSLGESGATQRLEYQHYLMDVNRACIMVLKYAGADGAGDVTSGGTPRGSISILADFCEAGTEQLTAQRREQWVDSFQYRQQ